MTQYMVSQRPEYVGAWAVYPYDPALLKRFMFQDINGEPYALYKVQNGKLLLPRAVCPPGIVDRRVKSVDINFKSSVVPRNDIQRAIISEAWDFLSEGQSGIIQAGTGIGKTVLAQELIARLGQKTLIVVTKEDLMEQWISAAKTFLGLSSDEIGIIQQDKCQVAGRKIVIGMVHSLAIEGKYPTSIRKEFGLVVYDEVHRLGADAFARVAGMFPSYWRLGLSATPKRTDGRTNLFTAHIGPVRVVYDAVNEVPRVYRYKTNFKLPLVPRRDSVTGVRKYVPLPHSPGKIGHIVKLMAADGERNALIARRAAEAVQAGRNTVVFSESLDHLDFLHERLINMGVPTNKMAFYIGGMKKGEREMAAKKPLLLATYRMMGEGTDIPHLDCAIFATPRSDIKQIAGRVLRLFPGKPPPVIIDLVDDCSHVFSAYANKRMVYYASIGAEICR